MSRQKKMHKKISVCAILFLGILFIIISMFVPYTFFAIIGVSIIFWGVIILYIAPSEHLPLNLVRALIDSQSANIERLLSELRFTEKGIYLPPNNLKNIEDSLIFLPRTPQTELPSIEETSEPLYAKQQKGVFITPPGLMLSKLFEQELNVSFLKVSFSYLQKIIPKLFIEKLELAESFEVHLHENTITVKLKNFILYDSFLDYNNHPFTNSQVGRILSSSLACAFAKVTGKPIIIQNETHSFKTKTSTMSFLIGRG